MGADVCHQWQVIRAILANAGVVHFDVHQALARPYPDAVSASSGQRDGKVAGEGAFWKCDFRAQRPST
jgi:hypothetical protein